MRRSALFYATTRANHSKGSKREEKLFWSRASRLAFLLLELRVKRLPLILCAIAVAAYKLFKNSILPAATTLEPQRTTWAKHLDSLTSLTGGRRYEHWMQMRFCHADYDHLMTSEEAARRRARCSKICGLCRHLQLLVVWPDPKYCRPSQTALNALEDESYYD